MQEKFIELNFTIDENVLERAQEIFVEEGISNEMFIRKMYELVIKQQGIPFSLIINDDLEIDYMDEESEPDR